MSSFACSTICFAFPDPTKYAGLIIYSHDDYLKLVDIKEVTAFPWLDTMEMNIKKPYFLIEPEFKEDKIIDERIAFLIKDTLQEFMSRGTAGRLASVLNRKDIGGKTGTTNDAVSTWFSGFHEDLVTTVWVGTDDFTSLGENEYGSTIALPIWLDFMQDALKNLEVKEKIIPEGISFVKVNKDTGVIDNSLDSQTYFELILKLLAKANQYQFGIFVHLSLQNVHMIN